MTPNGADGREDGGRVAGREQFPPSQGAEDTATLAASVLAEHLRWCATGLAESSGSHFSADLAETVRALADGQRQIAVTLGHLAEQAGFAAPSEDRLALIEVLRASALAANHTADALVEAGPLMEAAAGDTRL